MTAVVIEPSTMIWKAWGNALIDKSDDTAVALSGITGYRLGVIGISPPSFIGVFYGYFGMAEEAYVEQILRL